MSILYTLLTIVFVIVGVALTGIVLLQESKSSGLGALSGSNDTYWSKNKSRSAEGNLVRITKYLAIGFIVLAVVLNLSIFS